MPDRKPAPWQSGAVAPFLTIEKPRGVVEVWVLGEDRFRITAPGQEQLVTGFDERGPHLKRLPGDRDLLWVGRERPIVPARVSDRDSCPGRRASSYRAGLALGAPLGDRAPEVLAHRAHHRP
jgi:hypothetical protein